MPDDDVSWFGATTSVEKRGAVAPGTIVLERFPPTPKLSLAGALDLVWTAFQRC